MQQLGKLAKIFTNDDGALQWILGMLHLCIFSVSLTHRFAWLETSHLLRSRAPGMKRVSGVKFLCCDSEVPRITCR